MATNYIAFSNVGLIRCLNGGRTYLNTLLLCLIQSNTSIVNGFDATSPGWTEADFTGYARATLDYGAPLSNAAPPDADMTASLKTFTASADVTPNQTIYGWAVIDPADNKWIYGANVNRTPAIVIAANGDQYRQTPRFTGAPMSTYP